MNVTADRARDIIRAAHHPRRAQLLLQVNENPHLLAGLSDDEVVPVLMERVLIAGSVDDTPRVVRAVRGRIENNLCNGAERIFTTLAAPACAAACAVLAGSAAALGVGMAVTAGASLVASNTLLKDDQGASERERKARRDARVAGVLGTVAGSAGATVPWMLYSCPYMFPPLAWIAGALGGGLTVGIGTMVALPIVGAGAALTGTYYVSKACRK